MTIQRMQRCTGPVSCRCCRLHLVVVVDVQVGKDTAAQAFLARVDNDSDVGKLVGTSSLYATRQATSECTHTCYL